jgi:MFS family permease
MVKIANAPSRGRSMTGEEVKVIAASSAGTIFEWYDFYLYGSLAAVIGTKFFSSFDENTRAIFALLAFAAGFLVRPFGALLFGRLGDLIGRKSTFLITILIMGVSTFAVGLLPDYNTIGWAAPVLLIVLRMAQGLALGGEYGGAAVYVAEHSPAGRRGFYTSWIQTTATLGLLLSLFVIVGLRLWMGEEAFQDTGEKGFDLGFLGLKGGWRIPFLLSIILFGLSLIIRLTLNESPAFQKIKDEGTASKAPLSEAFGSWHPVFAPLLVVIGLAGIAAGYLGYGFWALLAIPAIIGLIVANMARIANGRIVILALLGLVVGQAVVWYTGQFYALFFLGNILKADLLTANSLVAWSLIIGTPFFLLFGALSDRVGRRNVILIGCLIAALTYFPLFQGLTKFVNPTLETALGTVKVEIVADPAGCGSVFDPVGIRQFSAPCDTTRRALATAAIPYKLTEGAPGSSVKVTVNGKDVAVDKNFAANAMAAAVAEGFPTANDPDILKINSPLEVWTNPRAIGAVAILTIMIIYVTIVYGPIAAALVEFFPARIRYTAMSLPYHIGNGWFGGLLPATSFAMVASTGDIYYGLWYPIAFAVMTAVIGFLFIRDPGEKNMDVRH